MQFSHLHCHTQYSLLDGQANIKKLIQKAKADNMPAVAITDHGNMFGVFEFVAEAAKQGIKPIVGCEFYVVEDHHIKQFTKEKKDVRYHQLLLAKNATGYKNLAKLCSLGYMEGLYGKYPRVTKALIEQYKEGLIASTCCIGAMVPKTILKKGEAAGEIEFKWWLDQFGEDYYVELQRHEIPDQIKANEVLVRFAKKYNVKIIASNDSHYVDQDDWVAHDILLCVNTGEKQSTPSMKEFSDDEAMPKNTRFAFFSDQFYFKNTQEMTTLFKDMPQAIDNTNEIVDKVETLKLKRDIMLPNFPIPTEFQKHSALVPDHDVLNQWEYLRHLTYEGAKKRYVDISQEVQERLDFELFTIRTMGFAGYFLIVADFIQAGRDIGVMVGPGRGSAAGSAVAYCIGITNIDPIKYNLLFERFLNPDRKSMPDIDTDFDDEGRQKVIDYVVNKYGKQQVAAIVTYGTMAAKSAIKDVSRVMDLPLNDANALAKLVPDKPTYNMTLKRIFEDPIDGPGGLSNIISPDEVENVRKMRALEKGDQGVGRIMKLIDTEKVQNVLQQARRLEGTVRNTGVHAAGIIIAPSDLSDIVPISTSKETNLIITQYEGKVIEDAGVIKMDFLGLRNLTIIKECLRLIKQNYGLVIDIDEIPLDDPKPYELFQRGETNAIFQFESDGMKKYMKDLKPDRFEDLIAMNALYRPGPIQYIPNFINRKHGREAVTYDLPEMEEYLADTYGITVYQEQLMLLSQKLGNFTKGDADVLRKAMGKKDRATLDKMKGKFMDGCAANKLPAKACAKVWTDWEAFAAYAFNKSHSTCYAFVAYQTAWLKAHYRAEYMASVLTSCLGNIEKITFFLEECKNIGIPVLGPDVNESERVFGVNKKGEIRFGLGAIKGSGDAAVENIIEERTQNGPFTDLYDFITRVNLRTVNKKTIESLAYAGGFDTLDETFHRAQFFEIAAGDNACYIEKIIRYANTHHAEKSASQQSLFGGGAGNDVAMPRPKPPIVTPWNQIEKLKYEKDVVGFYITGHPLDEFQVELDGFCNCTLDKVYETNAPDLRIGGIVSAVQTRIAKNGNPFMIFKLEDYQGSMEMTLFGDDYARMAQYVEVGLFLHVSGKTQNRWNSDQLEFKPTGIRYLSEIREKLCKELLITLDIALLSDHMITRIDELIKAHPGTCNLLMKVVDNDERVEVGLLSRSLRVAPANTLLNALRTIDGVQCKVA